MLKKGMLCALFLSFPSKFLLMDNEILMMSKLYPGQSVNMCDLTFKSCNLLCFTSMKQHRFNLLYNRFLSRRPKKQMTHLTDWIHLNTFY